MKPKGQTLVDTEAHPNPKLAAQFGLKPKSVVCVDSDPCPGCKKLNGEINHPRGMNFVGWGLGWQPCLTCNGTGFVRSITEGTA